MKDPGVRVYSISECVVFRSTKGKWGALSNMAPGFPVTVANFEFRTIEALYQACRFPHRPDVQNLIAAQASPMVAKKIARDHDLLSRHDWQTLRTRVMRWCLRLKLSQHPQSFGKILTATNNENIVELSPDDEFWGAKREGQLLKGKNVLGRLLMELRSQWNLGTHKEIFKNQPLISEILLFGKKV